jgi:hypothetical protein
MVEQVVVPVGEEGEELSTTAPITILYHLNTELVVETTVIGEARNIVTVALKHGSTTLWSVTMTETSPVAKTTFPIRIGSLEIQKGATFEMTIPTAGPEGQPGQVFMQATIVVHGAEQPFSAVVATWPLSS